MENLKPIFLCQKECAYAVEEGETLNAIAEKFSTTENLIILDNFLKNKIKTGDKLYIKSYKTIYVVTPFDTLESIALKFAVSAEEILNINKISYIYVGERIVIPN
jgi:spore germination protein